MLRDVAIVTSYLCMLSLLLLPAAAAAAGWQLSAAADCCCKSGKGSRLAVAFAAVAVQGVQKIQGLPCAAFENRQFMINFRQ